MLLQMLAGLSRVHSFRSISNKTAGCLRTVRTDAQKRCDAEVKTFQVRTSRLCWRQLYSSGRPPAPLRCIADATRTETQDRNRRAALLFLSSFMKQSPRLFSKEVTQTVGHRRNSASLELLLGFRTVARRSATIQAENRLFLL